MDEAKTSLANRGARHGRDAWFATAVLACGFFLGVTQQLAAARVPGDIAIARSTSGLEPESNAATRPAPPDHLDVGEKFTEQTKDHEYRFTLDGSQDTLHLRVSAEVHRGRIEWDLVDPTGKVRTHIGITEHGNMDTGDMKTIKGEWLLRIKLEDATGKYNIHWTQ